jgi:hypothetical protein
MFDFKKTALVGTNLDRFLEFEPQGASFEVASLSIFPTRSVSEGTTCFVTVVSLVRSLANALTRRVMISTGFFGRSSGSAQLQN